MSESKFRELCEELVDVCDNPSPPQYKADVLNRARAAVATPPPTDEELDELWDEEARYFNLYEEARCFARAVLERWGQ